MRKKILAFISSILLAFPALGQVTQKGTIVELSSGNKPVTGVEILVTGAMPTVSDENGEFRLFFPDAANGDPLLVNRIYKKGYEIVNETEVKTKSLSGSVPLKIVLCRAGLLEEARRNYYQIGEDLYYQRYTALVDDLKQEQQKGKINRLEYEKQFEAYKTQFYDLMSRLYYYADHFARMNKDELSETDIRAFALLEEGKVDEAIRVYEESGLIEEFYEKSDRFLLKDGL